MSDPKLRQSSVKNSCNSDNKSRLRNSGNCSKYELIEARTSELNLQKVLGLSSFIS